MKLVDDWRARLRHAYSIRFALAGAICTGAVAALPSLADDIPPRLFAFLIFVATLGAAISVLVAQPKTLGGGDGGQ